MSLRVAIYGRFSCELQRTESLDDQVFQVRQGLEKLGIDASNALVFTDEAVSGAKGEESRTGYRQLLELARQRGLDIIAVDDQSRFGRRDDVYSTINDFVFHGIRFISVGEGIDTARDGWQTSVKMHEFKNSFDNRQRAQSVRRGRSGRVRAGGSAGDFPYGYASEPEDPEWATRRGGPPKPRKKVVIFEEEAQWVRKAFAWFVNGWSMGKIARELTKLGAQKSTRGHVKAWHPEVISYMLRNEKYVGIWKYGKMRSLHHSSGKRRDIPAQPADIAEDSRPHLRIIDQDSWNRAQAMLEALCKKLTHHSSTKGGRQPPPYTRDHPNGLLNGLLICNACGAQFHARGNQRSKAFCCSAYVTGQCGVRTRVNRKEAEEGVLNVVSEYLTRSPEWVHDVTEAMKKSLDKPRAAVGPRLKALQSEIDKLDKDIKNLVGLAAQNPTCFDELQEGMVERKAHKRELVQEHERLSKAAIDPGRMPDDKWILERLAELKSHIPNLTPRALALVRSLIGPIRVVEHRPEGEYYGWIELHFQLNGCGIVRELATKDAASPVFLAEDACRDEDDNKNEIVISLRRLSSAERHGPKVYELVQQGVAFKEIAKRMGMSGTGIRYAYSQYMKRLRATGTTG
jgi:DNA invertase Pin-like site-specific DNA recombinase